MNGFTYKVILRETDGHESVIYERIATDDKSDFVISHCAETVAWKLRNQYTGYSKKRTKSSITHIVKY